MKIPKIKFKFTSETIESYQKDLLIVMHVPGMQQKHDMFVEITKDQRFDTEEKMLGLISFLVE